MKSIIIVAVLFFIIASSYAQIGSIVSTALSPLTGAAGIVGKVAYMAAILAIPGGSIIVPLLSYIFDAVAYLPLSVAGLLGA